MKRQLFECFGPKFEVTEDENDFAVDQAFKAVQAFEDEMERKGREIGDVMVATGNQQRPYVYGSIPLIEGQPDQFFRVQ